MTSNHKDKGRVAEAETVLLVNILDVFERKDQLLQVSNEKSVQAATLTFVRVPGRKLRKQK